MSVTTAETSRRGGRSAAIAVAIAALFIGLRAAILWSREPFFDELFSAWMARRPTSAILRALLHDSGPPLYYVFARFDAILALRLFSTLIAAVPVAVLFRQRRWVAALLLTVHPVAALFAVTARPYALCATFLAVAILYLERDRVWPAAGAFVAAAYTHYYGVLFFPTLLFCRAPLRQRMLAAVAAAVTFVPGLVLSFRQPEAATAWMVRPDLQDALSALAFLSDDPHVSLPVTLILALLTIVAVSRSWRHAGFVVVPLALALAISFILRPAYFPGRFASVLAFPLALWIESSVQVWGGVRKRLLVIALTSTGIAAIGASVIEHMARPLSDYRQAALVLERKTSPSETFVATGFMYLEAVYQMPNRRIQSFPREQAQHPGWRTPLRLDVDVSTLPPTSFIWVGERKAPELQAILRARQVTVLFANEDALIARVD